MNDATPNELALIWAMDAGRCIGHNGTLPWHFSEDLKHFKRTTLNHVILMGRRTWESFPKALPKRTHVVLTHQTDYEAQGARVFSDLKTALRWSWERDPKPFVIGGAQIYEAALPYATELYVTAIDGQHTGDTYFPIFDEKDWEIIDENAGETDGLRFLKYRRLAKRS